MSFTTLLLRYFVRIKRLKDAVEAITETAKSVENSVSELVQTTEKRLKWSVATTTHCFVLTLAFTWNKIMTRRSTLFLISLNRTNETWTKMDEAILPAEIFALRKDIENVFNRKIHAQFEDE